MNANLINPSRGGFQRRELVLCLGLPLLSGLAPSTGFAASASATRLNGGRPIIDFSFAGVGSNINGPSLIRIPDWIATSQRAHPSAVYYLYFADHGGTNIRLAWAKNIQGPYTMHNPGAGVLKLGIKVGNLTVADHIASPDVHVDHANRRIVMYFHGGSVKWKGSERGQSTLVGTSSTGLDFNGGVRETVLGPSYFRVFSYKGWLYAMEKAGDIYKARSASDPWNASGVDLTSTDLWRKPSNHPFTFSNRHIRHSALAVVGDTLHVWFSCIGDVAERIEYANINLASGDWSSWKGSNPQEVLKPELTWEGVNYPLIKSVSGSATNVRQLRDPAYFRDSDGASYLLYTGQGEEGIGLASIPDVGGGSGGAPPDVPTATNSLQVSLSMGVGKRLESTNRAYRFELQGDGNLVVSSAAGAVVWAADTQGKGGTRLTLQTDGNLVLYTAANKAIWASNTVGSAVNHLLMQNDGRLSLRTSAGAQVWVR
jgi:hypothetical protein